MQYITVALLPGDQAGSCDDPMVGEGKITCSGLEPNVEYTVKVKALDDQGNEIIAAGRVRSVRHRCAAGADRQPGDQYPTASSFVLTWGAVTGADAGAGVNGYRVEVDGGTAVCDESTSDVKDGVVGVPRAR